MDGRADMKVYRIVNYEVLFEKSGQHTKNGKQIGKASWVAVSNNIANAKYQRMVRHERAVELCAAWHHLVLAASLLPVRGTLLDEEGNALTADDIGLMTGLPAAIFELALKVLVDQPFGWIEVIDIDAKAYIAEHKEKMRRGQPRRDMGSHGETWADMPHQGQTKPDSDSDGQPTGHNKTGQDIDFTHSGGVDDPGEDGEATVSPADAAVAAFDAWSFARPPVGCGKLLSGSQRDEIRQLADELVTDTPIARGDTLTPRCLLISEAVQMLRARGSPFRSISYARQSVINELDEWAAGGPKVQPGGKSARASPRKSGADTQLARLDEVLAAGGDQ